MKLFGSSGIRGLANIEITPELALNVGKAAGRGCTTAVIARDPRVSGHMIEEATASGLMASGCDVTRLGIVPTPTLAYVANKFDLGVMITASHNTAQYIGIKLWNPDGMAFDSDQQKEIEQSIYMSDYTHAAWDGIGSLKIYENAVEDHITAILNLIDPPDDAPKVVVDCGSGAGSVITPLLLRRMGCRVLTLNAQTDGHFTARNPEPKQENLELLMRTVIDQGADLGIAHDGDADRMMAVDDKGRFVGGDQLLAILAIYENADSIVVPVDTSMVVDESLPGASINRSKVGDVYVAECMKKIGASFGGEPSGSWIFPRISFCPDGIYAAARLIEITGDRKLSKQVDELPKYQTRRTGIVCDKQKMDDVMERITAALASLGKVSTIDGIKIVNDDGWVLIRPSGTEPKIRITAEARRKVDEQFEIITHVVEEAIAS